VIDYQNRMRAIAQQRAAMEAQMQAASQNRGYSGGAAQALGGVNYSGNAAAEGYRNAARHGMNALDAESNAYTNEQAAAYDRQMRLAEQEQRNRYQMGMAQSNAGANEAAIKAKAVSGMMGGMGNIGSPSAQTPSVNLYDNYGNRMGGSFFKSALLS
jgi:hypothetical protein